MELEIRPGVGLKRRTIHLNEGRLGRLALALGSATLLPGLARALVRRRVQRRLASSSRLAVAVAASAWAAVAVGAMSIGALAIGRLKVRSVHIQHLRVDVLDVGQTSGRT